MLIKAQLPLDFNRHKIKTKLTLKRSSAKIFKFWQFFRTKVVLKMSQIYITEPPTHGKVLLETTGPLHHILYLWIGRRNVRIQARLVLQINRILISNFIFSVGEIEIELFARECPKACRNFVQLCMENYYDKTKFHRVVKDFIVQGGDPSGTGQGQLSIS